MKKLIYLFLEGIFRQVFGNFSKKVIFQNEHDRKKYIKGIIYS